MSKVPGRCNKRCCQARRNLSKRPEQYYRWPTCHVNGCDGKMYVDEYRLRKGEKDHAPTCRSGVCQYNHITRNHTPYHRVSERQCVGYRKYMDERYKRGKSKHSPIKDEAFAPF